MKKFLRKICRPIDLFELLFVSLVLLVFIIALLECCPDVLAVDLEFMEFIGGLSYSPAVIVSYLMLAGVVAGFLTCFCISLFQGLLDWLIGLFLKRRKGPKAVKDNLLEIYVDDVTLDRVEQMADMAGISVPVFCYCVLQSLDMDYFIAVREQMDKEADHAE